MNKRKKIYVWIPLILLLVFSLACIVVHRNGGKQTHFQLSQLGKKVPVSYMKTLGSETQIIVFLAPWTPINKEFLSKLKALKRQLKRPLTCIFYKTKNRNYTRTHFSKVCDKFSWDPKGIGVINMGVQSFPEIFGVDNNNKIFYHKRNIK